MVLVPGNHTVSNNGHRVIKVLIVDDSELLQSRLKIEFLKVNEHMNIMQAYNFDAALKIFSAFNPETVILDISLPDGSGIDLLRRFKNENQMVRVIIFTNYPTREFRKRCMEIGADEFMDKSNLTLLLNSIK